jgi:nucleoside-diphosphate-sugar epimerase
VETTRQRVLVTGANGVIGRVLLERLSDRYDLTALTRRPVDFPSHVGDIADLDAILPAFEGIDAVVHMAGSSPVESPWDAVLQSNIIGAYNVFEAARRSGVETLIFASTNHTIGGYEMDGAPDLYRLNDERVYDHTVEVRPDSLYGVSKVFGEALGRYYHDAFGMRVFNLRIGSLREDNNPRSPAVASSSGWLQLEPVEAYARLRSTWLSQRDGAELIACCLEAHDVDWAVVYGISNNPRQFWDIGHARNVLGYDPQDSAPIGDEP